MVEIDDSALLHYSKGYDPAKAREYYLRTRELKGRKQGLVPDTSPNRVTKKEFERAATGNEGKYTAAREKAAAEAEAAQKARRQENRAEKAEQQARRAEMEKQKQALKDRLETLNNILAQLVKAAKTRSGIKAAPVKSDPEDTSSDKASRNESAKKDTPLTTSQKREKAEKAREEYQKESPGPSLSTELTQLRAKVEAVKAQIEKARAEAAKNPPKQANQTARSGR